MVCLELLPLLSSLLEVLYRCLERVSTSLNTPSWAWCPRHYLLQSPQLLLDRLLSLGRFLVLKERLVSGDITGFFVKVLMVGLYLVASTLCKKGTRIELTS